MLVAAAVCPHPPLLVPELMAGAAREADDLRGAADTAVARLVGARPELVVVVGGAPVTGPVHADGVVDLSRYGLSRREQPGSSEPLGAPRLPLSLAIGQWLLDRSGWSGERALVGVAADTSPRECADLGAALVRRGGRRALLVMGDGSARRGVKAPGYLDDRAEAFDRRAVGALSRLDTRALLALEPALAADLLVAGRAPWQVLAGALDGGLDSVGAGDARPAGRWAAHAEVHYDAAPFGVAYVVLSIGSTPTC